MIGVIFLIVGLALLYYGYDCRRKVKAADKECSLVVEAECMSVTVQGPLDQGVEHCYPKLRYSYKGEDYLTDGKESVGTQVKVGEYYSIYIDPEHPSHYRLVKRGNSIFSLSALVFGAVFVFMGIMLIID